MAVIDDLNKAYANMASQLAAATANPKTSYSVDGESYSWTEYQNFLLTQMRELKNQIQIEAGPFQVQSRGIT